jgi:hypothetical protein
MYLSAARRRNTGMPWTRNVTGARHVRRLCRGACADRLENRSTTDVMRMEIGDGPAALPRLIRGDLDDAPDNGARLFTYEDGATLHWHRECFRDTSAPGIAGAAAQKRISSVALPCV